MWQYLFTENGISREYTKIIFVIMKILQTLKTHPYKSERKFQDHYHKDEYLKGSCRVQSSDKYLYTCYSNGNIFWH